MLKIQGTIPRKVGVAVSGGVDSMAILHFLSRNHEVTAYCFDHGTEYGKRALDFVAEMCARQSITLQRGLLQNTKPSDKSQEEHWRDERYAWFKTFDQDIVTAHHLDDCVETWVFNMLNGRDYTIPYRHANIIRPFRTTTKQQMIDYAARNNVSYVEDPSNDDTKHMRNHIRHNLLPPMLKVNPGLPKVIKKKLLNDL